MSCAQKSTLDAEFNTIMAIMEEQRAEIETLKTYNEKLREFLGVLKTAIYIENPPSSLIEYDYTGIL